ncbi:hypothetical protein TcasGA2_TC003536 [Tribolium castaneum]|uniref:Uncharacterized protein n=1 Tax=Tribolium castaneum TaxID=7070 RepID=D6WHF7_TRICA|nr:hypothetical protein TcasGA2_TC003536 [Tribolium castaneum]
MPRIKTVIKFPICLRDMYRKASKMCFNHRKQITECFCDPASVDKVMLVIDFVLKGVIITRRSNSSLKRSKRCHVVSPITDYISACVQGNKRICAEIGDSAADVPVQEEDRARATPPLASTLKAAAAHRQFITHTGCSSAGLIFISVICRVFTSCHFTRNALRQILEAALHIRRGFESSNILFLRRHFFKDKWYLERIFNQLVYTSLDMCDKSRICTTNGGEKFVESYTKWRVLIKVIPNVGRNRGMYYKPHNLKVPGSYRHRQAPVYSETSFVMECHSITHRSFEKSCQVAKMT